MNRTGRRFRRPHRYDYQCRWSWPLVDRSPTARHDRQDNWLIGDHLHRAKRFARSEKRRSSKHARGISKVRLRLHVIGSASGLVCVLCRVLAAVRRPDAASPLAARGLERCLSLRCCFVLAALGLWRPASPSPDTTAPEPEIMVEMGRFYNGRFGFRGVLSRQSRASFDAEGHLCRLSRVRRLGPQRQFFGPVADCLLLCRCGDEAACRIAKRLVLSPLSPHGVNSDRIVRPC